MSRKADIAAELRDEIRTGRYGPGDRLPRVADLEDRFNVTIWDSYGLTEAGTVLGTVGFMSPDAIAKSWMSC